MKNLLLFLFLFPVICSAQPGYINTIAGNFLSSYSGDGGPATAASMDEALGNVVVDGSGNIYFGDHRNHRIRKVDASGIISTFAGTGIPGHSADGIPAISANLDLYGDGVMSIDVIGNIYITEGHSIRKIDITSGILTTVAGSGSTLIGDGGPATAGTLNGPVGLCFDRAGNMYIGDQNNHRVRKVNTAGIITTIAGTGSSGFSGDGGPATAARLNSPDGVCVDAAGNIYVADRYNQRIRRIDPSGIISTFAGTGVSGFAGDGGPATAARFIEPSQVCMDGSNNLYVADFHNSRVRKITPAGIISTFAGGGTSIASGVPATAASFAGVWAIGVGRYDDIYISDRNHYRICKTSGSGAPVAFADSFTVYINTPCTGPMFMIAPTHYATSLSVKTWFGDGTVQTDPFLSGYSSFNHVYNYSGTYTIKHVLYNGITPLDSTTYNYTYNFCRTLPVRLYQDIIADCIFDPGSEFYTNSPTRIEIDSNGVAIDTIHILSGFDYYANGLPGDIYKFKVLSTVPGIVASCPVSGIVTDTLTAGINTTKYLGFNCTGTPGFDLKQNTFVRSGVHMQSGHVIVNNAYCSPQGTTVTLDISPKYQYVSASPAATTVVGNTITWNLGALSSIDAAPITIYYELTNSGPRLTPGDTVNSVYNVTPATGDALPIDNHCNRNDTVKGSYDPNAIHVSPEGYIAAGTTLTYSIEFENTGNDTAHNIYVLDTLPGTLDIRSLAMVASTHSVFLSKTFNGSDWVLKFDFPNIKLLDSSYHNLCTGMFVYTINVRTPLAPGTVIPNRAGIYFDGNEVVMTNTATDVINLLGLQHAVTDHAAIELYPNPVTNMLHIDKVPAHTAYRIADVLGKTIMNGELQTGANTISMQSLVHGLYMIELTDAQGNRSVNKIVRE